MPKIKRSQNKKNNKKRVSNPVKPKVLANNVSPRPILVRRQGVKRNPATGFSMKHTHGVCAVSNPTCPAAKGSKWPDGTMGNTMTEQFRANRTIVSLAAGDSALALAPAVPFGFLAAASSAAGVVTFGATYTTYRAGSLLATFGHQYRITSMGAIIRCVATATTAGGFITLGTYGAPIAVSSTITLGSELYDQVQVHAIHPGMELTWIAQPRGAAARTFAGQSTSTSVVNDWTNLMIEMTGCPASTNMINVEWFINVEFEVLLNQSIAAVAPRNPPVSIKAQEAVSKVHSSIGSFITGGVKQVEETFMMHAEDALKSVLSDPLASIASLFI